jgi:PST family polysaccharide transporter
MLGKIQKLLPFGRKFSSGSRAIIANTGWLFADRILRMGVGLFVGVWVARYLGAKQFGLFNYASAFVALFNPISTLGLNAVVIRNIVNDSSNKEQVLGTTFCLKILGGIASLSLAVGSIYLFRGDDNLSVWLVAILATGGLFESFDTIDLLFQSQVQSKFTVVAKNTAFIIVTLLQVTLITMQAPLIAFAWVKLADFGLGALGLTIAYRVKGYSIKLWRWSFPLAKNLLKESLPLILSGLSIMIYVKIDQIMLGEIVGDKAVGIYSAATRISEVWYFIPMAICSSVNPSIYAAKEKNEELYYRRIRQLLRVMTLLSVMVAVPMTFLSGTVITMLFGSGYAEAGNVLAIHIWASLFVFMGVGASSWFVAEGLTHFSMYRSLMGAITNILLNLFLIPHFAEIGAAIATVISYAYGSVFANATHRKSWKIFQIQIQSYLFFLDRLSKKN